MEDENKSEISEKEIEELYKKIVFLTNIINYIQKELEDIEKKLYSYLDKQNKIIL